MILIVDTTRGTEIRIGLVTQRLATLRKKFERPGSHLVPMIDQLLKKQHTSVKKITGVIAATGPGPFSAVRAGVAVTNALGLALGIPVVGVKGEHSMTALVKRGSPKLYHARVGTILAPVYGQPPNISTKPR